MRLSTRRGWRAAFLCFLILFVCCLITPSASAATRFSDVPDTHPYAPAIIDLKARGVIMGFSAGTFRPNSHMTRQQLAKVIVKTLGLTVTGSETCPFRDVRPGLSSTDPFYPDKYIAVCAAAGIMTGKTASTFDPTADVTRAQLITTMARAATLAEPPAAYSPSFGSFDPTHYSWARKAAYAGLLDGLRGMGPDFNFFAPATRGEVAEVLTGDRRYGVDYSMTKVDWQAFFRQLKASGRDFIGRYLPWRGSAWRQVTKAELEAATAAGVDFFFWFEDSDNHFSARNGFAQGAADAEEALRALERLGVPPETPVYYTVDYPASVGGEIDAYFRGINSVVPVSQVGVYGNYTTIDWVYKNGLASYFCQSNAWSQPQGWHPVGPDAPRRDQPHHRRCPLRQAYGDDGRFRPVSPPGGVRCTLPLQRRLVQHRPTPRLLGQLRKVIHAWGLGHRLLPRHPPGLDSGEGPDRRGGRRLPRRSEAGNHRPGRPRIHLPGERMVYRHPHRRQPHGGDRPQLE